MARKKRGGRRRGMLANLARKAGSIAGTIVQTLGMSHGLIKGAAYVLGGGDPAKAPREIVWGYTGYNIDDGNLDQGQLVKSATIIGVTFIVGKALKWVARH